MERDMDLIRQILLKTEQMAFWTARPTGLAAEETWREKSAGPDFRAVEDYRDTEGFLDLGGYLGIEGYSAEKISYHVKIMGDAGLIETKVQPANSVYAEYSSTRVHIPVGLTWWGHEFLEAVKDDTRWSNVKNVMLKAGGFVFEIASSLAIRLLEEQVSSVLSPN